MDIVGIAVLAMAGTIVSIIIKQTRPELSFVITIACAAMILSLGLSKVSSVLNLIKTMEEYISINKNYIEYIIKIIGISYVSEFSADLCRDAGHNAVATQIGIFGKISILTISMPVIMALIETVSGMLS